MLALTIDPFHIELKDGAIKNVGPTTKAAAAKLFDVGSVEARAFGDERIKLVFTDDEGNEVQAAVTDAQARTIVDDLEALAGSEADVD